MTHLNIAVQRKMTLQATRSQMRGQGIDPATASVEAFDAVADDLARGDNGVVRDWWNNSSESQYKLWKRDIRKWQRGEKECA